MTTARDLAAILVTVVIAGNLPLPAAAGAWVLGLLIAGTFGGLALLCWVDPGNKAGRR